MIETKKSRSVRTAGFFVLGSGLQKSVQIAGRVGGAAYWMSAMYFAASSGFLSAKSFSSSLLKMMVAVSM